MADNVVKSNWEGSSPAVRYCAEHTIKFEPLQKELFDATSKHEYSEMAGAPEVIQINMNMMRLIHAKRVLDIGTYTGISAYAAALCVPEDGEVLTMDITDEYWAEVGKPVIDKSPVFRKIKLKVQPGLETLDELLEKGEAGTWDFAFVDAYHWDYADYLDKVIPLLRSGGVMAVDNALWEGGVLDTKNTEDEEAIITAKGNDKLFNDPRVYPAMLPVGDGLFLAFKK